MNDNVVDLHTSGHSVRVPAELPYTEEMRAVFMSEDEIKVLEKLGLRLGDIGATATSLLLLGLAARWKVAS